MRLPDADAAQSPELDAVYAKFRGTRGIVSNVIKSFGHAPAQKPEHLESYSGTIGDKEGDVPFFGLRFLSYGLDFIRLKKFRDRGVRSGGRPFDPGEPLRAHRIGPLRKVIGLFP